MDEKLETAVLKTLAYSDIFDYPLRISELYLYLIGFRLDNPSELSFIFMDYHGEKQGLSRIGERNGYFFLQGREKLVGLRQRREKITQEKMQKARKVLHVLKHIPFIKMVAVSGTVAAGNADENSDIDVLIVTQKNRLWLARLLAIILMELKGVRRRPNQVTPLTHQDKFCLNMFISKESLELPRKDLFTANEFARMKTVWEKENTYQSFMQANHWIQNYLPNWKPNIKSSKFKVQSSKLSSKLKIKLPFTFKLLARFYTLIFTLCTNSLETVARIVQLNYMAKRKTTEVVTNGLLMFHPHDAREWVMKTYENRLAKLGLVDT